MEDDLRALQLRIGTNVKRLRLLRGLSQEKLGGVIGRERKHIGEVEQGKVNLTLVTLSKLAKYFSVDVPYLCRSEASSTSEPATYSIMRRDLDQIARIIDRVKRSASPRARAKRRRSTKR